MSYVCSVYIDIDELCDYGRTYSVLIIEECGFEQLFFLKSPRYNIVICRNLYYSTFYLIQLTTVKVRLFFDQLTLLELLFISEDFQLQ